MTVSSGRMVRAEFLFITYNFSFFLINLVGKEKNYRVVSELCRILCCHLESVVLCVIACHGRMVAPLLIFVIQPMGTHVSNPAVIHLFLINNGLQIPFTYTSFSVCLCTCLLSAYRAYSRVLFSLVALLFFRNFY